MHRTYTGIVGSASIFLRSCTWQNFCSFQITVPKTRKSIIFMPTPPLCMHLYICFKLSVSFFRYGPNGHISAHSPSIRRWNSTWKVHGNYIDFKRRIHADIMTSIQRGFDFQNWRNIDEFSTWNFLCRFDVKSTKLLYSLFPFYYFLTFSALGAYSKLFWYNAESL